MTKCNRCQSTSVAWGKTKDGHPYLVEVGTIPHKQFCPAQKGKLAKKPKVEQTPEQTDAVAALRVLGIPPQEAARAVEGAPDGLGAEEVLKWALKERGKE